VTIDGPTNPELLFLAHALHVSLIMLGKANLGVLIQLCPLLGGEDIVRAILRCHYGSLLFLRGRELIHINLRHAGRQNGLDNVEGEADAVWESVEVCNEGP
jgi:hypothetical protein